MLSVLDVGASKIVCLIARLTPMERVRVAARPHASRQSSASAISARAASRPARSSISTRPRARSASPSTRPSAWPGSRSRASSSICPAAGSVRNCSPPRSAFTARRSARTRCIACSRRHARASARDGPRGAARHRRPDFRLDAQTRHPRSQRHDRRRTRRGACMSPRCDAAAARNLMLAIERCHLDVDGDGRDALRRRACRRWSTTRPNSAPRWSISAPARRRSACSPAAGSPMSTASRSAAITSRWTSRAASPSALADAERLKTLYGACIASPSDERETIAVASRRRRHATSEPTAEVGAGAHHPPARRGNPRAGARPAEGGRPRQPRRAAGWC